MRQLSEGQISAEATFSCTTVWPTYFNQEQIDITLMRKVVVQGLKRRLSQAVR